MRSHLRIMLAAGASGLLAGGPAKAELATKILTYKQDGTELKGYLARDDAFKGPRAGVLVFPEWWGLNDYAQRRADQLARLGYVAMAVDMYGSARTARSAEEAAKLAGAVRADRKLMRARARAALEELKSQPEVDRARLAAIGFCFGGTCALELARSGADLAAVVSFHGGLDTPEPADARNIKARVLVLTGAEDPHVPPEQLAAFEKEMRDAKVNWQINLYGGAVHSFTNPAAGNDPASGAAYDELAARRAWAAMKLFFAETIGLPAPPGSGVGEFARDKTAKPVAEAGKATGRAVSHGVNWAWEKITGED